MRPTSAVLALVLGIGLVTSGCGGATPADSTAAVGSPSATVAEEGTVEPTPEVSLLPTETTVTAPPESEDVSESGADPSAAGPSSPPVDGQSGDLETALERALAATTETLVTEALDTQGISLSSGPKCTADLTRQGSGATATGTVTCIGTSDAGRAVDSTFDGTVTAGGECEGRLVVRVGGTNVVQRQVTECGVDVP